MTSTSYITRDTHRIESAARRAERAAERAERAAIRIEQAVRQLEQQASRARWEKELASTERFWMVCIFLNFVLVLIAGIIW